MERSFVIADSDRDDRAATESGGNNTGLFVLRRQALGREFSLQSHIVQLEELPDRWETLWFDKLETVECKKVYDIIYQEEYQLKQLMGLQHSLPPCFVMKFEMDENVWQRRLGFDRQCYGDAYQ